MDAGDTMNDPTEARSVLIDIKYLLVFILLVGLLQLVGVIKILHHLGK